jgi:hypothetical protein
MFQMLAAPTKSELLVLFTRLYLGLPKRYTLVFPKARLTFIENIFDEIILENGIRSVEFNYRLVDIYIPENSQLTP